MIQCIRTVVLLFLGIALLSSCKKKGCNHAKSRIDQEKIKTVFQEWVQSEIKAGNYWSLDSCNPEYIKQHHTNSRIDHAIGIPDNAKITYAFSDFNNDGVLDGLVTFFPKQCDCEPQNSWTQYQILVESNNHSYAVKDTFFTGIGNNQKGFYHIDSVTAGNFYGTYFEFQNGDNQCCPSIERPIEIAYDKRELQFLR